ncbi:MAG: hypothetical protein QG670_425 [Thermoproteota archaeon]|nr:hypothetical protein [Thermoproteota archaeon]
MVVLVNGLAGGTSIIGGKNTAQISNSNLTLITPAGYVFSIWGIIYVLLGIFIVYQALPSQQGNDYQQKIGVLFILSSIFNIVWLFLWQFEYLVFSVALMFLLLITLILIYLCLNIGKTKISMRERLAVHLPFSVYLGWITIASIANVAVTLVSLGWNGFGISGLTWATIITIVILLITSIMVVTRKDVAYSLVIIWALIGISVGQGGNQTVVLLIQASAVVIAVEVAATSLFSMFRKK